MFCDPRLWESLGYKNGFRVCRSKFPLPIGKARFSLLRGEGTWTHGLAQSMWTVNRGELASTFAILLVLVLLFRTLRRPSCLSPEQIPQIWISGACSRLPRGEPCHALASPICLLSVLPLFSYGPINLKLLLIYSHS